VIPEGDWERLRDGARPGGFPCQVAGSGNPGVREGAVKLGHVCATTYEFRRALGELANDRRRSPTSSKDAEFARAQRAVKICLNC
jgi:hypothetical protein